MKWNYTIIILLTFTLFGMGTYFKPNYLKAEDTEMQVITKDDPVTKEKIEFHLKLYTLQNLNELIPSISQHKEPAAIADKYIFCIVKNLSKHAISIKFKIISPNAPIRSWSPEVVMRWLSASDVGVGSQQYSLIWLGSPSLGIPDSEVKLDIEILELQRK